MQPPHAYRQGLNKEKKGIRSIWECAENTSQSRWWKQTVKYLSEVMHIKNNGFATKKEAISTAQEHEWKCGRLDRQISVFDILEQAIQRECICFRNPEFLFDEKHSLN